MFELVQIKFVLGLSKLIIFVFPITYKGEFANIFTYSFHIFFLEYISAY